MSSPAQTPRSARPKPSTGVRIAQIVYAAIPIATAAVLFLGSFI